MSFVVNFRTFRPSVRQDGNLWTTALIQEASVTADTGEPGAFSTIDTKDIAALYPAYDDATDPPYMSFTTELATQLPGWYRIIFQDATGDQEVTAPLLFGPAVSFRPSTRDVAVFIKNRTVDANNNYIGDFTDDTMVNRDEVEELIVKAEELVLPALDVDPNVPIPTESQQSVRSLIALYAAMLVELTKYSEQVARDVSPYPRLKELYDAQFLVVKEDILGPGAGGTGESGVGLWDLVQGQNMNAQYGFPSDPMVNWSTLF